MPDPLPPLDPDQPLPADGEDTTVTDSERHVLSGQGPAIGPDDEQRVITESETIRDRGDGTVGREGVRVESRRKRPLNPIAVAGVVILLLLAAGGVAWWLVARDDASTVPSVEGLSESAAVEELQSEGFESQVERRPSDEASGMVVSQDPAGGDEADEGSSVQLVVSTGPATKAVPNAVGLPEAEARDRLVAAGFTVSSRRAFDERDEGTVVSQSPAAGTEADPDASIQLVVSKGSGLVDVPDLVGLTRAQAEAELSSAGLEVNAVDVPSNEPNGTVVAQNPAGGQLQQGMSVRINVASAS
jgi:eukaryotic-like serine/threonine-protein kinase